MDGDIARYWLHVNAPILMVSCAFAAIGRSEIANAILIKRRFILFVLLNTNGPLQLDAVAGHYCSVFQ
jgi:hypothetical protein